MPSRSFLLGYDLNRTLVNLCPVDILALRGPLRTGFARIRRRSTLAFGFLRHAGLSF